MSYDVSGVIMTATYLSNDRELFIRWVVAHVLFSCFLLLS